jgi:hypothetical protein
LYHGIFLVAIYNKKSTGIAISPESQALQQQTASTGGHQMPETLQVHLLLSMFLQNKHLALSDNRSSNERVIGFQQSIS